MKREGTFGREMVFCDRRVNRVCVLQFLKDPLAPPDRLYILFIIYIYINVVRPTTAPNNNLTAFYPLHIIVVLYGCIHDMYNMSKSVGEQKKNKNKKPEMSFVPPRFSGDDCFIFLRTYFTPINCTVCRITPRIHITTTITIII